MVQRTGLALVFLIALCVSFLGAQQSPEMTIPRLLSEPVLEIPANWTQNYFPPEVMILVEVKVDSTATLIKILDGKDALKPLLDEQLPNMTFVPAMKSGTPFASTLSLKLKINKTGSAQGQAAADSLKKVDRAMILEESRHHLNNENRQNLFAQDTFYGTNYYLMGLNTQPDLINNFGFNQAPGLFYNAFRYQMIANFQSVHPDITGIQYPEFIGTIPKAGEIDASRSVMRTDVYAGLGDYEFNFAKGHISKGNLFGVNGFNTDIGFLVQNGWWQESISGQTSSRISLSAPFKISKQNSRLSFNIEKYDQNIPSTFLLPGLQNGRLFSIAQKYQDIKLGLKFGDYYLNWHAQNETLNSPGVLNKQAYHNEQLSIRSMFMIHPLDTMTKLSYQYNYKRDNPVVQSLYQYNHTPLHQGQIELERTQRLYYNIKALVTEDGLDKASFDLGYQNLDNATPGRASIYYDIYQGGKNTAVKQDLYVSSSPQYFPSAYVKNTLALKLLYPNIKWNSHADFAFGAKRFETTHFDDIDSVNVTKESDRLYSELFIKYRKTYGAYTAYIDQTLQWTQFRNDLTQMPASRNHSKQWKQFKGALYEQPEFTGQTRFKIVKDMKYNNALSVGLNLTGHSDYIQADAQNTAIWGSMIADVWFGVKITDLFEFQVMMQNLNNNLIFGLSPHPRTLIATIHWFYLN